MHPGVPVAVSATAGAAVGATPGPGDSGPARRGGLVRAPRTTRAPRVAPRRPGGDGARPGCPHPQRDGPAAGHRAPSRVHARPGLHPRRRAAHRAALADAFVGPRALGRRRGHDHRRLRDARAPGRLHHLRHAPAVAVRSSRGVGRDRDHRSSVHAHAAARARVGGVEPLARTGRRGTHRLRAVPRVRRAAARTSHGRSGPHRGGARPRARPGRRVPGHRQQRGVAIALPGRRAASRGPHPRPLARRRAVGRG